MGDILKIPDEYRQVQWAAAIQECKASGLTNKEYCIQHGLSDSRPWFPPCIKSGGLGHQRIGTGSVASLSAAQLSPPLVSSMYQVGRVRELTYSYKLRSGIKKSLADWRDFSVCVGITYLPDKSPCKYCRRR